jgi:hypothetical protein
MGWASVKGDSCARAPSPVIVRAGAPRFRNWAGVPVCALVRTDAPPAWGRARGQSPEAVQRCAEGAGLDGADEAHAILVRSNPHPVQGRGVRAKPEFKAQARFPPCSRDGRITSHPVGAPGAAQP